MIIDNNYIKSLAPCEDRHQNYLAYYKDCNHTVVEFLQLKHLSYEDKVWVWRKFATDETAIKWALKCAQSVLHIFEAKYPNNQKPRNALVAVENYLQNPTEENRLKCKRAYNIVRALYSSVANSYSTYSIFAAYSIYTVCIAARTVNANNAVNYMATRTFPNGKPSFTLELLIEIYKEH